MTLPMFVASPAGEAQAGSATSRAFRAVAASGDSGASFEMALGAMIAPTQTRTPPPEAPVELVLDGEWRLDLEQATDETVDPAGSELPADVSLTVEDGAVVPLGKSLESWLAAVGRRSASVPTDVRRGAAEEMADLVATELSVASSASFRRAVERQAPDAPLRPDGPVPQVRSEVSGAAVQTALPEQNELPSHNDRDVVVPPKASALGDGAALLDTDVRVRSESDLTPVDRAAQFTGSPYAAGLLVGGTQATSSSFTSEDEAPMGYRDRLIDPDSLQGESAPADSGVRRDGKPVEPVAGPRGWGGDRMLGMDQLLDEGLDPEALLARYEARHPAVEIGGFSFPLDALDAVVENSAPAGTGRGRAESTEASAYDRLRGTTLAAHSNGRQGSSTEPETGSNGQESGGKPAEQRAAIAARGLEELRINRPSAAVSEPLMTGSRNEQTDPVLLASPAAGQTPLESDAPEVASVPRPAAAAANDPTDRIARRVEHLMLNIADDQGEYGRLKVSVTGTSVRATILPNDPVLAERLTVDLRQLRQQLGDRGFADAVVTVQAPKAAEATAPSAALLARDLVETAGIDVRVADRPRAEENRRETPRDPREQNREEQRPSHRSRDQRQDKRGGQG